MESQELINLLLSLAQTNATHIDTLNREMGIVQAELGMIKWFIGANLVVWIGIIGKAIGDKILRKNGKI